MNETAQHILTPHILNPPENRLRPLGKRFSGVSEEAAKSVVPDLALIIAFILDVVIAPASHQSQMPLLLVFVADWPRQKPNLAREIAGNIKLTVFVLKFVGAILCLSSPALSTFCPDRQFNRSCFGF